MELGLKILGLLRRNQPQHDGKREQVNESRRSLLGYGLAAGAAAPFALAPAPPKTSSGWAVRMVVEAFPDWMGKPTAPLLTTSDTCETITRLGGDVVSVHEEAGRLARVIFDVEVASFHEGMRFKERELPSGGRASATLTLQTGQFGKALGSGLVEIQVVRPSFEQP